MRLLFLYVPSVGLEWSHARSLDLRLSLFFTMCSCVLWDCQTLLRNWVVIKVVIGCMTKYGIGFERIKMEFTTPR
jgi:hypothetical protein